LVHGRKVSFENRRVKKKNTKRGGNEKTQGEGYYLRGKNVGKLRKNLKSPNRGWGDTNFKTHVQKNPRGTRGTSGPRR